MARRAAHQAGLVSRIPVGAARAQCGSTADVILDSADQFYFRFPALVSHRTGSVLVRFLMFFLPYVLLKQSMFFLPQLVVIEKETR